MDDLEMAQMGQNVLEALKPLLKPYDPENAMMAAIICIECFVIINDTATSEDRRSMQDAISLSDCVKSHVFGSLIDRGWGGDKADD